MAPAAQARLDHLARGVFPDPDASGETLCRLGDRDDAAVAQVMLAANLAIIERAYPKKLLVESPDPRAELAAMLGVLPEDIP